MNAIRSQRWRDRREYWRPGAEEINPAEFTVDGISDVQAKPFVEQHHYSGTFPASQQSVGLFRGRHLVGVCTFSTPMNDAAIPKHTGHGPRAGVDLGRFVLLDEVAGNGETWFLKRAFALLREEKPLIQAVTSYADPEPIVGLDGELLKPGHVGGIYQNMAAAYRGRSKPRWNLILPNGKTFSERAVSKIRKREVGYAYAVDQLVALGAPRPANDNLSTWLEDLVRTEWFTRRRHPGNHVYAFYLNRRAKVAGRGLPNLPYPKA